MASPNQTVVRARIDSELKQTAEELLKAQHLDMSKALRMFFEAVVRDRGMPDGVHYGKAPPHISASTVALIARNGESVAKAGFAQDLALLQRQLSGEESRAHPNPAEVARLQHELADLHAGRFSRPAPMKVSVGRAPR